VPVKRLPPTVYGSWREGKHLVLQGRLLLLNFTKRWEDLAKARAASFWRKVMFNTDQEGIGYESLNDTAGKAD
jgi:hypothetical protein